MQSIDVFIPSINVGIEYQGIQHYEPVDFLGGAKGLRDRQKLDEKKRKLCQDNGVILIEWKYNEPINDIVLRTKLSKVLQ